MFYQRHKAFVDFAIYWAYKGYYIFVTILSSISFIFNLLCFIVFLNPKLIEDNIFFYFKIKSFVECLLVLIDGAEPLVDTYLKDTYFSWFYYIVSIHYFKNSCIFYTIFLEIVITINRYFIIKSKTKIFVRIRDIALAIIGALVCLLAYKPMLVCERVVLINSFYGIYGLGYSPICDLSTFNIYQISINSIQHLVPILILLPANIIVLMQYKKFIKKKRTVIAIGTSAATLIKVNREAKSQGRFTKMILIISFMFIIIRLLYGLMGLFQLLYGRSFRTMIFI